MLPTKNNSSPIICWIFCTVIDNYGDIGVTWRLVQELKRRLGWDIYLWLDQADALRALCPDLPPFPCQHCGIHLNLWQPEHSAANIEYSPPPNIIIETFACTLPDNALAVAHKHQPIWLNWEYLSAENWAEKMHTAASLLPEGTRKYFWLMGFTPSSGGLLRESNYINHALPTTDLSALQMLRSSLQLPEKTSPEWFIFGYHSPVWAQWLKMWQASDSPITLLLAGHQVCDSLRDVGSIPNIALQQAGDSWQVDCVQLIRIPFVPQTDFDSVLQLADGLIIRGEDSFVRAQYAAKPFFWHIYPQNEAAHLDKLQAFWSKTAPYYHQTVYEAHQRLSNELNGSTTLSAAQRLAAWQTLQQQFVPWQQNALSWQQALFAQTDAVSRLDDFIQSLDNVSV